LAPIPVTKSEQSCHTEAVFVYVTREIF
jgi:hypothetical protein